MKPFYRLLLLFVALAASCGTQPGDPGEGSDAGSFADADVVTTPLDEWCDLNYQEVPMADTTRDSFQPTQRYEVVVFQRGRDVLDAELNEAQDIARVHRSRGFRVAENDLSSSYAVGAALGDGFRVVSDNSTSNRITVKAGIATFGGYTVELPSDVNITGLTTPGGSRIDTVYAQLVEDERNAIQDPSIAVPRLGETSVRKRLLVTLAVVENSVTPPASSGGQPWEGGTRYFVLAKLNRSTSAIVRPWQIEDRRGGIMPNPARSASSHGTQLFLDREGMLVSRCYNMDEQWPYNNDLTNNTNGVIVLSGVGTQWTNTLAANEYVTKFHKALSVSIGSGFYNAAIPTVEWPESIEPVPAGGTIAHSAARFGGAVNSKSAVMEFDVSVANFTAGSATAGQQVHAVGLSSGTATTLALLRAEPYIAIVLDKALANWQLEVGNGTSFTRTDLGIPVVSTTAGGPVVRWRLEYHGLSQQQAVGGAATVIVYMNDAYVGSYTTNVVNETVLDIAMAPSFGYYATLNGTSHAMQLGRVQYRHTY